MSGTIQEAAQTVAEMQDYLRAAYSPLGGIFVHAALAVGCPSTRHPHYCLLHATVGMQHWSEPCADGCFADAAFRLRTRIAAEYRPEEGEAA